MDDLFDYFIQCIKYLKLKFYIADALELVLFVLKKKHHSMYNAFDGNVFLLPRSNITAFVKPSGWLGQYANLRNHFSMDILQSK